MLKKIHLSYLSLLITLFFYACSSPGSKIFGKKTPHEQYGKKIKDAGLEETALGDAWFKAAAITLSNPLDISLPYSETGYFANDRANAVGLRFSAKRGQKLRISLSKNPVENFAMYVDLWQPPPAGENRNPKLLLAADTVNLVLEYNVMEDSVFIVRIQPELLKEGEYTLTISAGPSLAFPISPKIKSSIGSFFGVGRDSGARKHEGIDIFAPFRSPAVAAANGVVTRVNENVLGGKVVFMRPDNAAYSLYYAHLDSQLVTEGKQVKAGDVLGLTGNTGNAKFTASHLHFGIYTYGGAIDPIHFVRSAGKEPAKLSVAINNLNTWMRSKKSARLYVSQTANNHNSIVLDENTLVRPEAGTGNQYRVILPDGKKGFIAGALVVSATKPLRKVTLKQPQPMLSSPDTSGLQKKQLAAGEKINVHAAFNDFYFISESNNEEGWILKKFL
jgi:murein DD-endopeptidase MepM/ murein hydrolase activator NlpD